MALKEAFSKLHSIACVKDVLLQFIWISLVVPFSGM
jgi:hypothetical protein